MSHSMLGGDGEAPNGPSNTFFLEHFILKTQSKNLSILKSNIRSDRLLQRLNSFVHKGRVVQLY